MFATWDVASGGLSNSKQKSSADRVCDQCKSKKVRCDMTKPCVNCTAKGTTCTYDRVRKKRGPAGKRIAEIRLHQQQHQHRHQLQRSLSASETESPSGGSNRAETVEGEARPWHSPTSAQRSSDTCSYAHITQNQQYQGTPGAAPSDASVSALTGESLMLSPNAFIFPSLPAESPTGSADPFGSLLEHDLPLLTPAADVWPPKVNETTLLPWIDVYFKRLHPTIPILNRASIYSDMLLRKHRTEPHYGAMLLGLCAFAMTQPVQIHERASMPSRAVQARMLMEECVKMRVAADFGESPTIEMILGSFYLFACLFGNGQHYAARHRLREAVDLAYSLGLHLPDSYVGLSTNAKEQWLRTYLVLSVTERAYALQKNHAISFRGQPGITARFMHAFDATVTSEYISSLIYQDRSDAVGMTGLLYLMDSFDAIDESVMDCWNGFCRLSDGVCENFDRRRALQMFRAQRRVREACISGNISFAPSVTPLPLSQLLETQQADIAVTQFWLLNRLWSLCLSHQLLLEDSEHMELRFDFACGIAHATLRFCNRIALASMEVHGVGFIEKVFDVASGVIVALSSARIHLDMLVPAIDLEPQSHHQSTVGAVLEGLETLIRDFRGGDHPYNARFAAALAALPRG